jgi:dihydroorotase
VQNIHVINAEQTFLPHLRKLHAYFPRLRIVLEHATTRAAVEAVKSLGSTVACTITAHHLALTVDDWAGQSWNYCKPVAKFPDDRKALREVIREGKVITSVHCERRPDPNQAIHVFSWDPILHHILLLRSQRAHQTRVAQRGFILPRSYCL